MELGRGERERERKKRAKKKSGDAREKWHGLATFVDRYGQRRGCIINNVNILLPRVKMDIEPSRLITGHTCNDQLFLFGIVFTQSFGVVGVPP